ncbi:MAG: SRPBCC family protein [Acidimicrobiia bacterium]
MDLNHYEFTSVWPLDYPADLVFLALKQLEDYPAWWPEVRATARIDDESARVTVRSALPYDLAFVVRQVRADPEAGVLEASMHGDLSGFSRWSIVATPTGAQATFFESVDAEKVLLRQLAAVARPAFKANHTLMMRHGRRGLRTYLAGVRLGVASRHQE